MTELSVSVSPAGSAAHLPEAPAKVTARSLNFYYGEHHALKNINVTLGTNRVTAFIGPSGCGKSTLLRIFNRMYDLYPGQRAVGELKLDHTDILDPKLDLNLLRARVGFWNTMPTRARRRLRSSLGSRMSVLSSFNSPTARWPG